MEHNIYVRKIQKEGDCHGQSGGRTHSGTEHRNIVYHPGAGRHSNKRINCNNLDNHGDTGDRLYFIDKKS